jgi:hypothetical protein
VLREVRVVARGQKTLRPQDIPDTDLLEHLPMLEALSSPDTPIEPGASVLQLSAIQFARIAECALEQYAKSLRQGTVTDFRRRVRILIESTLAEGCYLAGRWHGLHQLADAGVLSPSIFNEIMHSLKEQEKEIWHATAGHVAAILRDVKARSERAGKKGRPTGSGSADALLALQDAGILKDATTLAASNTKAAIEAAIPHVVREYLRLGQLRTMGSTEQEAVDRHSKRIRAQFDGLVATNSGGGSSIIRKAK